MNVTSVGKSTHYSIKQFVAVNTTFNIINVIDASNIIRLEDISAEGKTDFKIVEVDEELNVYLFNNTYEFVFSGTDKKVTKYTSNRWKTRVGEDTLNLYMFVGPCSYYVLRIEKYGRVEIELLDNNKTSIVYNC